MNIFSNANLILQYKLFMENSLEMLIFFDSHGRIIECNAKAAKELGYGEDIYRLPVYYIFKRAFSYHDKQLKLDIKYQNNSAEAIAYRKNQTCFPVELRVAFVDDGRSNVGICSAFDITDKKELNQEVKNLRNELKSFNQINSELMANVTHELRTPINGIAGFSNSLLKTELNTDQLEAVNIIKRSCINMNMIINDLLDYAKISNNKLRLENREFNFRNVIQEIIDINKIRINEKGLKLLVDISDEIPDAVIGDELRLKQILNNLFSNAIKFTSVGHICLEVSKITEIGKYIELFFMILDTGIGISLEDKDKLFKSFSQVDNSITRRFGGTGLGLSITKKLVEAMDGTIAVDSEKNKGSTFSFSLRFMLPHMVYLTPDDDNVLQPDIAEYEAGSEAGGDKAFSEIDYINARLKESRTSSLPKLYSKEMMKEAKKEMSGRLEKLAICIEMENWEMAEEVSGSIKGLVPREHTEVSKMILRLLMAVRKENRDTSFEIINILKQEILKEENGEYNLHST